MNFVVVKIERACGAPGSGITEILKYYAGYESEGLAKSGPIFNRNATKLSKFDERTADLAVKQLRELCHVVEKRPLFEKRRKHE